jgi:hypothetical protein
MARRVERDFFYILTAKHGGATNVHGVIEKFASHVAEESRVA